MTTEQKGILSRRAHAIMVFEEPVRGPVLIGAGRYWGIGYGYID